MMPPLAALAAPVTAEFQQGLNDYAGTVDMRLRAQDTLDGSGRATNDVDGGDAALGDSLYALGFIRFDNVFGSEPGQVPYGSHIVSASLDVVTNVSSNAQSGNIFTVSALIDPLLLPETGTIFSAYNNTGGGFGGPDFQDNYTLRPGNPFRSVNAPVLTQDQGETTSSDITEVVRHWATGSADAPLNNGLIIADANGTDGWGISSSGNGVPENRPKLRISYYPPAEAALREAETLSFKQGNFNDTTQLTYENCVSVWIPDTVSAVNAANFPVLAARTPIDGNTIIGGQYLDGVNAAADSPDDQMIIQFKDLFGDQPGQIKIRPSLRIERAVLRLTTGPSGSANSPGPVDIQRMLQPWYTEDESGARTFKAFTDFKAPDAPSGTVGRGPTEATGDVAPAEYSYWGMSFNQILDGDVTASVQAWAAGAPNYGWSIQQSTSDGWQLFFPGASNADLRPELLITYSYDPDADNDGLSDEWETANGTNPAVADADADPDADGLTNKQEYDLGTKPTLADTDGDKLNDKAETNTGKWVSVTDTGTDPLVADSDGDGLPDGLENPDLSYTGATQPGSDPNEMDTDGDGLPDSSELAFETDPSSATSVPTPVFENVMTENFDGQALNSTPEFTTTLGSFLAGVMGSEVPAHGNTAQITDGSATVNSSVAWGYVAAKGKAVRLTFDYRLSADVGTAEAADGFGIGLFRTATYEQSGAANPGALPKAWEDPRTGGGYPDAVFFGFDIYNGTTEGNNVRVTGPADPGAALINKALSVPINSGVFNRVVITGITVGTSSVFSMDLISDVDGAAPVTTAVFKNLLVPGFDVTKEEFRVIAGARNGTSVVKSEFDNISLAAAGTSIVTPPAAPAFSITGLVRTESPAGLTVTWDSVAGGVYTVERSENLSGAWTAVGTAVTATGAVSTLTDALPENPPTALFYRVRRSQ
ncbi:MAG: hypothetical protein EOP86_03755 [Verrucomicrobiaceae bacterium]|nr:MAG: hypothetical protein EOP86_03755 [Verrucomicrobiaceae bacterium]